jgi:hypothetical protein
MNANENKIQGQSFEFLSLAGSEQVKVSITVVLSQYPIGPVILLLEFNT